MALEGRWSEIHDPGPQLEVEHRYRNVNPVRPFVRPAFYAALLTPVAALPFETAFRVWTVIWWAVLVMCCWWAAKALHPDAIIWALFLPAGLGIAHGQDCVLMMALMALSYALADREKPFSAGSAAGLLVCNLESTLIHPDQKLYQEWFCQPDMFVARQDGRV
jgi:hypothetical protein